MLDGTVDVQQEMKASGLAAWLEYQRTHDERYHRDILWLNPDKRAKHYILHFSQHVGRLAALRRSYNDVEWNRVVADIMMSALSAAHAVPLPSSAFEPSRVDEGVHLLVEDYLGQRKALSLAFLPWMQEELALATAGMAHACVQLDHGRATEYRRLIEEGVYRIVILVLAVARMLKIDMAHLLKTHWDDRARSAEMV